MGAESRDMAALMHEARAAANPSEDLHRYFPEWADRPAEQGRLAEFDHNSYLAGGYSEELGHLTWTDRGAAAGLPPKVDPEHTRQARTRRSSRAIRALVLVDPGRNLRHQALLRPSAQSVATGAYAWHALDAQTSTRRSSASSRS